MREFLTFSGPETQKRMLRTVYNQGASTRQELADRMECSLLTASKTVTALLEEGVMITDGTMSSTGGRRKDILKINPEYRVCLCADIGYGSIKLALVALNGDVIKKETISSGVNPIRDGIPYDRMIVQMERMLEAVDRERMLGIAVGISGMVSFEEGKVLFCPNIHGFDNRSLAEELEARFDLPVLLDTSARCMAAGEYRFGAGRGLNEQICLSLGRGSIAAGILMDGRLYRGKDGYAGEIGHTCIRPGERVVKCSCGGYDCLELYATLQMLCGNVRHELYGEEIAAGRIPAEKELTAENLKELVEAGHPVATGCLEKAIDDIATVLVGVVNLFAPEAVIVGGGFSECFPGILEALEKKVCSACLTPLRERIRLLPSVLKGESALRGAAAMMIGRYFGEEL